MGADVSRDPVFGEVARGLAPRGLPLSRRFFSREIVVHVVYRRFEAGSPEDLVLRSQGGVVRHQDSEERDRLFAPREWLEQASSVSPALSCLLAAADNANANARLPRILGIVNVTPDSFSDGGNFLDPGRAIEHGLRLVEEGADLLDVGGESTRPGSEPIDADEELCRIEPVVEGLARRTKVTISVDTMKSDVARGALDAGATIVNDVSAGRFDSALIPVVADRGAGLIVMHMQGDPRTMQQAPHYADVVTDVTEFLRERCAAALEAGVDRTKLWIDPGIGFGKALEHNLELIRRLPELRSLGLPICLGVSRKSFIDKVTQRTTEPHARIGGSAAALTIGVLGGAEILRVHDVATMREAALVARALARS